MGVVPFFLLTLKIQNKMENLSFGLLNLCTMYKCSFDGFSINAFSTGTRRYCFGNYTEKLRREMYRPEEKLDVTLDIKIRTFEHFSKKRDSLNNFCLLGKKDIEEHFAYLSETYCIDCDVKVFGDDFKELGDNEVPEENYCLKLHLNATPGQQVFALTWCRHLYEYPFNVFLIDALHLKEEVGEFRNEHLANILQVIGSSFSKVREYMHDQSLCFPYRELITENRLCKHLESHKRITEAWDGLPSEKRDAIKPIPANKEEIVKSDYWLDPQTFDQRKNVYLQNYMSVYNFIG